MEGELLDRSERILTGRRRLTRTLLAGLGAAVAALLLFGWLAEEVLEGDTVRIDGAVRGAVHSWASPAFTYAMRGVTQFGSSYILVPLGALLVWRFLAAGRKRAAIIFVAAALGAEVLTEILKLIIRRPRPEAFFGLPGPSTYSFPSGHATISFCFYGVLAVILTARGRGREHATAIWAGAAVLAAAIGFSRVYLGVHYPSDVIAGYAAGAIWVAAVRIGYAIDTHRRLRRNE